MTINGSVVHDILSGRARIALAITQPEAGSDVQGLQTEARLSDDGSHFIINGQKVSQEDSPRPETEVGLGELSHETYV
ncbi:Acyl-CoA dehydrogenase apdG like protein [Verticillium longisporum]|nr:Acyl-CoA dehydrogenase apdG like protein [Verticillium longisporum]KAG7146341.1 Acyl-CoA dehydrogenase apdG like protein [Verticillium longisporum]